MPKRIEQVNELLKSELGALIARNNPLYNGLITITHVNCSADLKYAKIGVSVLPDNFFGTALARLRGFSGEYARELRKKIKLRRIPKLNWVADDTEKKAAKIEGAIKEIMEKGL